LANHATSCTHTGLEHYLNIDSNAPFSVALGKHYPWSSYVISIGACAGTFNTAFASLYAMSRLMVVLSRCRLIPQALVGHPHHSQGLADTATHAADSKIFDAQLLRLQAQQCLN
jgi:amino acid transporter